MIIRVVRSLAGWITLAAAATACGDGGSSLGGLTRPGDNGNGNGSAADGNETGDGPSTSGDAGGGGDDATARDGSTPPPGPPGSVGAIAYKEGFGNAVTGGTGKPTFVVTSSAATGAGALVNAFPGGAAHDVSIVFAVAKATLPSSVYVGSNVTIDGMANGQNGVTLDFASASKGFVIEDPASNIVLRGLNLRGAGAPNSGVQDRDLVALDGTNGASITGIFVDRCTFFQASDGALDITGNVSNVTVQRSFFYANAKTMLVKYGARQNISVHHNVFAHNGERNPQIKGAMQLVDYVNNVVYLNDVAAYSDGTSTSPYGVRVWSGGAGSDSPGNVVGNFVANAFIGAGAAMEVMADPGASNTGVFIDASGSLFTPALNGNASPKAVANVIPPSFVVTALPIAKLGASMLPYVGAPNRTALDQQRLDEVAAALP